MHATREEQVLLIDTCGEAGGVALSAGSRVLSVTQMTQGAASAQIVGAVGLLLAEAAWKLTDLTAIGVVSGPGSFTGMRTGLAAAKGLCEAAGLPLAAVSRLEVLAEAAELEEGFAVLDAGRGELYVRQLMRGEKPREFLCKSAELAVCVRGAGKRVAAGDGKSADLLAGTGAELWPVTLRDALPAILRRIRSGAADAALVEANYVRLERDIYPRRPGS